MAPILAGIETEYGLLVEGRGTEDQVDDATQVVRSFPGPCLEGWDYRFESPRADLRGFTLKSLAYDPEDAKFDRGRTHGADSDLRADRVLPNGARLYNDHGHPEYATPECWSVAELALHDKAGEIAVRSAANAFTEATGRPVKLYKNNTDFHGASYGTHESYLVPREVGFERLYEAITPMLITRQVLTGAGKVGAENDRQARFQLSQRADFVTEPANAETLYRRPVFNTRDEPHADPARWIRLHVISGDANMMASCTARKVALVKMAIELCVRDLAPSFRISDPVAAFRAISKDDTRKYVIQTADGWTTAYDVLDSYLSAFERCVLPEHPDAEMRQIAQECRELLDGVLAFDPVVASRIDWAAKREMLEQFMEAEGAQWHDPNLRSLDLEYHNLDPDEGLYYAMVQMGQIEPEPKQIDLLERLEEVREDSRARARGIAVSRFKNELAGVSWGWLTFKGDQEPIRLELPPDQTYGSDLHAAEDVESFVRSIRGTQ